MITKKEAKKLVRLIKRHVEAEIADSWKGGGDPKDIPVIEKEAAKARELLNKFLAELQGATL